MDGRGVQPQLISEPRQGDHANASRGNADGRGKKGDFGTAAGRVKSYDTHTDEAEAAR